MKKSNLDLNTSTSTEPMTTSSSTPQPSGKMIAGVLNFGGNCQEEIKEAPQFARFENVEQVQIIDTTEVK